MRFWREALAEDAAHVAARLSLALHYQERGEAGEAQPHLAALRARLPDDPRILTLLGVNQYRLGHYRPAVAVLARAAEPRAVHGRASGGIPGSFWEDGLAPDRLAPYYLHLAYRTVGNEDAAGEAWTRFLDELDRWRRDLERRPPDVLNVSLLESVRTRSERGLPLPEDARLAEDRLRAPLELRRLLPVALSRVDRRQGACGFGGGQAVPVPPCEMLQEPLQVAIKGAELGAKVAIVEHGTIGGTCVNIGCVPSKTLIKAAELCYRSAYPKFEGLAACPPPSDWQRVVQQKDELVAALRQGKYVDVMKIYPTVTLIQGRATLTGKRTVTVNGTAYTPSKVLVATGSRPWAPPIPGLAEAGYLDSTEALSLPELPASLLVIGDGAIGLELGQLFARFGVRVMIIEGGPHVAGAEEPEIGTALTEYLAGEKIRVCTNVKIARVERAGSEYRVQAEIDGKPETCVADQLLVATGRRPDTADLGLAEAGVQTGARGEIVVDPHLQTANPNVYAAGDCLGDPMYVYVAAYAGGLAAENALTGAGRVYDLSALPHVIFTDPQVASVGLSEAAARAQGKRVKTAVLYLKDVPRALAARDTRGLFKLVAEEETGKLLGAHVLADQAGEVIQAATLAVRFGLRIQDLVETFHPYLTMVEGLKLAALTFQKDVSRLSCCAA